MLYAFLSVQNLGRISQKGAEYNSEQQDKCLAGYIFIFIDILLCDCTQPFSVGDWKISSKELATFFLLQSSLSAIQKSPTE